MKCSVFNIAFSFIIFSAVSYIYSDTLHEVQTGDTLYSISKKYGVSLDTIKEANGFSDNSIKVGQKIKIPSSSKNVSVTDSNSSAKSGAMQNPSLPDGAYIVQKGETWFGISKKYGITVADLQKLNGVGNEASLKVGQKIKVPGKSSSASSGTKLASAKTSSDASKNSAATKASSAKVPDLKSKDPHNYSSKKADSSLVWPVKTANIVYINGKVGGVSMAAKKDEEVKAIRAGTVMFSGSYRGFGNVVFIQSKTGHIYAYTGLGSIDVSKGDYINYSSEIGTAGIDTYTGKSQISLMVFQNGQPIDPAKAPRG